MNGTLDTLVPSVDEANNPPGDAGSSIDMAQEQGVRVMERLFAAAQPGAVFSAPFVSGQYTVITASEVSVGGGFGSGRGFGPAGVSAGTGEATGEGTPSQFQASGGGGFGGGGGSTARPVATIVIGPDGVKVVPVMDITKLALAGITAWGAMIVALRKMRRAGK
jgi:uncharacterized spore protein YtfJ